jgi:hypothetical protein
MAAAYTTVLAEGLSDIKMACIDISELVYQAGRDSKPELFLPQT